MLIKRLLPILEVQRSSLRKLPASTGGGGGGGGTPVVISNNFRVLNNKRQKYRG